MNVSDAVANRQSIRAFLPDPVPGHVVLDILEKAGSAPSGGNLQPWRVYAFAGAPLAALLAAVDGRDDIEPMEYDIYPPNLWDPFRRRRYENAEQLYASVGVSRENKAGRRQWLARNARMFGAPVGLFFCLDRELGRPQWADLGMYMQNVMLLAAEKGYDTCAQEFWGQYPLTVAQHLALPDELMVFAGMALGRRDPDHAINQWRSERDPSSVWLRMEGFTGGEVV